MSSVLYFDCPTISSNIVGFDADGSQYLRKSALILCEGSWKDNKGVIHRFNPNRIYKIAERTNQLYQEGKKVGIYKDHKVDTDNKVGDYVGKFSVREITQTDLDLESHPKLEKLLGKMAIFADNQNIVLKDPEIIKKYENGLIGGISPGINQVSDTIAEISVTPRPAMAYATLFMEGDAGAIDPDTTPITWEQINNSYRDFEEKEARIDEINSKFKQLCKNIIKSQNVQNSQQLLIEAVEGQKKQLLEELGVVVEEPNSTNRSQQDVYSSDNSGRFKERMSSLIQFAQEQDQRRGGVSYTALGAGTAAAAGGGYGISRLLKRVGERQAEAGRLTSLGQARKILQQKNAVTINESKAQSLAKQIDDVNNRIARAKEFKKKGFFGNLGEVAKEPFQRGSKFRQVGANILGKTTKGRLNRAGVLLGTGALIGGGAYLDQNRRRA